MLSPGQVFYAGIVLNYRTDLVLVLVYEINPFKALIGVLYFAFVTNYFDGTESCIYSC